MKIKSLFDHINHITSKQTKGYWDSLNEREKKQWSNYMINRFLSMKMEWTDFVNEIQKLKLDSYQLYVVYSSILPKGKQYLKYIKKKKQTIYNTQVVQKISEYFQISRPIQPYQTNIENAFWLDGLAAFHRRDWRTSPIAQLAAASMPPACRQVFQQLFSTSPAVRNSAPWTRRSLRRISEPRPAEKKPRPPARPRRRKHSIKGNQTNSKHGAEFNGQYKKD